MCYCPQVASEHVRKIFRTGEAIDEGATSVGMKTPGLNGLAPCGRIRIPEEVMGESTSLLQWKPQHVRDDRTVE